jgi:protocatechuate 3,4-dioxygenase beta subunit
MLRRLTPACSTEENPPMQLDADDVLIGRVLTRREVLVLFGTAGTAAALAACTPGATATGIPAASAAATVSPGASGTAAAPACIVRPALTEGPYFVDERLLRSDIRSDPSGAAEREGLPLEIAFAVSQINGTECTALANALVDVWHCDAAGQYSDVQDQGFDTTGQKWLRGYQVTDAAGNATFLTIYPGWYQGRTVHIHFMIRLDPDSSAGLEFTSQLFFDDATSDQVFANAPYAAKGERGTRNENDGIYGQSEGLLTLALTGDATSGYSARFEIGVAT